MGENRSRLKDWGQLLTQRWPADASTKDRALVLPAAMTMGASVPFFLFFAVQYVVLGLELSALALMVGGLWVVACLLALPRAGGLRWPIHGFCLSIVSVLLLISLDSGGVQAPAFYWFIVIAPVAVNFLPWREAVAWICVGLAVVGLLAFASADHLIPVTRLEPRTEDVLHIFSLFGLLFVTTGLTFIFRVSDENNVRRFKRINRELDEARKRAQAASDAKTRFLANMSHEIRTPMNAVLGMAELLATSDLPSEHRTMADTIKTSSSSLLGIVNDVLDFSAIEADQIKMESKPFDLADVVRQLVEMMRMTALQQRLDLDLDSELDGPNWVRGDTVRVRQVLANLLGNALKFTQEGRVGLRVTPRQDQVEFEVWDTGIGMSRAVLERLFDPFFQADASTRRRFGGTGLGLTISDRLVKEMGGLLEVESQEGQGTRFRFSLMLPRVQAPEEDPAAEREAIAGLKVLVVEDNRVNREVARRMLDRLHCRVGMAVDGEDALRCCEADSYDALLMDCDMPVMDGFECTRELRKRYGRTHRVIAFSASVDVRDRERCQEAGMDDFLPKPVRLEALCRVLSRVAKDRAPGDPSADTVDRENHGRHVG
ncbi:MAG: ATP-binding protein [Myxococcota bacterium]